MLGSRPSYTAAHQHFSDRFTLAIRARYYHILQMLGIELCAKKSSILPPPLSA